MKVSDLGFIVRFEIGSIPVDSIELWTHEFSEMSLVDLLGESCIISLMINDVSGSCRRAFVSIPHIMVSLHTLSGIKYLDGSEKTLKPDEFASQVLKRRNER